MRNNARQKGRKTRRQTGKQTEYERKVCNVANQHFYTAVCPKGLDPVYKVSYNIKWVKTKLKGNKDTK